MDSLEEMYDSFEAKATGSTSNHDLVESLSSLQDLDPSLELSVDIQQLLEGSLNTPEVQDPTAPHPLSTTHVQQDEQLFPIVPEFFSRTTDSPEPQPPVVEVTPIEDEPMPEPTTSTVELAESGSSFVFVKEESVPEAASPVPSPQQAATPGEHNYFTVTETELRTGSLPVPSPSQHEYRAKATPPSKGASRNRRNVDKDSEEYLLRRQRNNIAVRKSRDKAKQRQRETEGKVQELLNENERLNKKVDLLTKELSVLKGLFANVGAVLPPEVEKYLAS